MDGVRRGGKPWTVVCIQTECNKVDTLFSSRLSAESSLMKTSEKTVTHWARFSSKAFITRKMQVTKCL
jgi:hypothetical protein